MNWQVCKSFQKVNMLCKESLNTRVFQPNLEPMVVFSLLRVNKFYFLISMVRIIPTQSSVFRVVGSSNSQCILANLHHKRGLCRELSAPWSWPFALKWDSESLVQQHSFNLTLFLTLLSLGPSDRAVNIKFWVVITRRSNLAYPCGSLGRSCVVRRILSHGWAWWESVVIN